MGRFSLNRLPSIERWWELVFSAYLMISLHAQAFKDEAARNTQLSSKLSTCWEFSQHPCWELGINWKSALNNLRLIISPISFGV